MFGLLIFSGPNQEFSRMSCFRLTDDGSGACMTALAHSFHKMN